MTGSRKVFIHVGHGKTGTSFLQNAMAINRNVLSAHGIEFLSAKSDEDANAGLVTSGNARDCLTSLSALNDFLDQTDSAKSVLLSSEFAFLHFPNLIESEEGAAALFEILIRHGIDAIDLLLFIRNPISFAVSDWLQRVKAHRGTDTIEEFLESQHARYPERASRLLDLVDGRNFVSLTIFNYSRHRDEILDLFCGWLSIDAAEWRLPKRRHVNRSLTYSEAYVCRALNASGARFAGHLGKHLVDEVDNPPLTPICLSQPVQEAFIQSVYHSMEKVSARTACGHGYEIDWIGLQDGQEVELVFNEKQVDIIVRFLIDARSSGDKLLVESLSRRIDGLKKADETTAQNKEAPG